MPDTPLMPTRGRTTQKRVSSRMRLRAFFTNDTVATTCELSSLSEMAVTVPITTSLYLTGVLPASRPCAVLNVIVISGPTDNHAWITIDRPINAATSGTSQTSESRRRLRVTGGSWGSRPCGPDGGFMLLRRPK